MKLEEAKVLITGGSSGIGRETARMLKEAGAQVAVCGRDPNRLKNTEEELGVLAIQADVSDPDDVKKMVSSVINEFGDYNVLINNAAYGYFSPLTDINLEDFNQQLAVKLTGAMLVAQESAKHFVPRSSGTIVNISSTAGLKGFPGGTPYVATKFALKGMTQCWAQELRKHNVRVCLVNPSEVMTRFAENAGYDQKLSDRKLRGTEIAHAIVGALTMDDRSFIPELTVWATNPE